MAKWYKMVRVHGTTHEWLAAARDRMQRAYERGQLCDVEIGSDGRITFDQCVRLLAQRDADHNVRRQRHAAKKRSTKKAAGGETPPSAANLG